MEQPRKIATAINLMRMALALLDEGGEDLAACHLQHAISVATREPVMRPGDELLADDLRLRSSRKTAG